MSKVLIGLSGYAQVGKDEVGKYLVSKGFKRIALADPVRTTAYGLNPIIPVTTTRVQELGLSWEDSVGVDNEFSHYVFYYLQVIVDAIGWDMAKTIAPVREFLQKVGTEGGRDVHGENCWINIARQAIEKLDKVVVTDVRFPNEAEFIHEFPNRTTSVVRIDRPNYGPINEHSSDSGLCSELYNCHILNDGSINDLHYKVDSVLSDIG